MSNYGASESETVYEDLEGSYFVNPSEEGGQEGQPGEDNQQSDQSFDQSQFVSASEYNKLKQSFDELQPKMQVLDRMSQAFGNQQEEQIDPRTKGVYDLIDGRADQRLEQKLDEKLKPILQSIETSQNNQINDICTSIGFKRPSQALNWVLAVEDEMRYAGQDGDQTAAQLSDAIQQAYNSQNWVGLATFVKDNFGRLNSYAGSYARKAPVQPQVLGTSFSNNAMPQGQPASPQQYKEAIQRARQAGDTQRVNALLSEVQDLAKSAMR